MDGIMCQPVVDNGLPLFFAEVEAVCAFQSQGRSLHFLDIGQPFFVAVQGILAAQNMSILLRAFVHLRFRQSPLGLIMLVYHEGALPHKVLLRR